MPIQEPSKTLGPVSARLIYELQKKGKPIFTLREACSLYKKNLFATSDLLSELVKRGILARIKKSVFLILRTGFENSQLQNWPITAAALSSPQPYFISHYSAMRLHGLTTHPNLDITITMPLRRKPKQVASLDYQFIYCQKKYFFGGASLWVTKTDQVQVSDLERTLLDGLDRPELSGGLIEVVQGLKTKYQDIHYHKFLSYAKKWATKAAVKRLGFIFETLALDKQEFILQLQAIIRNARGYNLLDPNSANRGSYLNRWGLRLNINLKELKTR